MNVSACAHREGIGSSGVELQATESPMDRGAGNRTLSSERAEHSQALSHLFSPMHSPHFIISSLILIISWHLLLWDLDSSCLSRTLRCSLRWLEVFLISTCS